MARMKNRWIVIVTILVSVLFHAGVGLIIWKYNLGPALPDQDNKPMYVNLVNAPKGSIQDQIQKGSIQDVPLPANNQVPDDAKILGYRNNRVDRETHRKNVPFNRFSKQTGPRGKGRTKAMSGGNVGKGQGSDNKSGTGGPKGKAKASTKDLINSVSYSNLKGGGTGDANGRGGSISPYNPKVGSPGDAISLNTREFKYMSYFASIKEKIEWAWVYPQQAQNMGQQGILTLTFTIMRSGRLKSVKLNKSSGYSILDRAAMQAVRDAADFAPMPAAWEENELKITANFHYRLIGSKYVY